ncbi:MAG: hypothetical protein OEV15_07045 [Gallionella sp.]|nr:hypothetical protein [Gallionella sp.]
MPIASFANLLFGAGVPTISPSIPSLVFTSRTFAADLALGFAEAEVSVALDEVPVSGLFFDAQPNRNTRQIAGITNLFCNILISPWRIAKLMDCDLKKKVQKKQLPEFFHAEQACLNSTPKN